MTYTCTTVFGDGSWLEQKCHGIGLGITIRLRNMEMVFISILIVAGVRSSLSMNEEGFQF